jgi:ribosomal protein S3
MDRGYAVAVKKLGTIGVTVQIMRNGIKLPHEISVFSEEELRIRADSETAEVEVVEEASE